jgi:hypothetical protein
VPGAHALQLKSEAVPATNAPAGQTSGAGVRVKVVVSVMVMTLFAWFVLKAQ